MAMLLLCICILVYGYVPVLYILLYGYVPVLNIFVYGYVTVLYMYISVWPGFCSVLLTKDKHKALIVSKLLLTRDSMSRVNKDFNILLS